MSVVAESPRGQDLPALLSRCIVDVDSLSRVFKLVDGKGVQGISGPIENWANLRHEPHYQSRPLQGQVPELPGNAANGSWKLKFLCDISLTLENPVLS
jgi:hypothetical protein